MYIRNKIAENGPKFRVLYAKNYNGSKKVHHRRFCGGDLYQLCPKPDVFWNLGSERISIE